MSLAITEAPAAAKATAVARPMPWAAAVTNTVLPVSDAIALPPVELPEAIDAI
jgi:hypothetical protein